MAESKDRTWREGWGDYRVHTEVDINAPAELAWTTLTDFDTMSQWSSQLQSITGDFRDGGKVVVTVHAFRRTMTFNHVLIDFIEGSQFGWSAPVALGMVDHHVYRIEPVSETTSRFVHTDRSKGGLTWLLGRLGTRTAKNIYADFNKQFKAETERRYAATTP